jgi:hypothetical protein
VTYFFLFLLIFGAKVYRITAAKKTAREFLTWNARDDTGNSYTQNNSMLMMSTVNYPKDKLAASGSRISPR